MYIYLKSKIEYIQNIPNLLIGTIVFNRKNKIKMSSNDR